MRAARRRADLAETLQVDSALGGLGVAASAFVGICRLTVRVAIGKDKRVIGKPLADEATEDRLGLGAGLHDRHRVKKQPGTIGRPAIDEDVLVADQVASGKDGWHLSAAHTRSTVSHGEGKRLPECRKSSGRKRDSARSCACSNLS